MWYFLLLLLVNFFVPLQNIDVFFGVNTTLSGTDRGKFCLNATFLGFRLFWPKNQKHTERVA